MKEESGQTPTIQIVTNLEQAQNVQSGEKINGYLGILFQNNKWRDI